MKRSTRIERDRDAVNSRQCVVRVRNKRYSIRNREKLIGCRVVTPIARVQLTRVSTKTSTFSICRGHCLRNSPRRVSHWSARIESNYYFVESRSSPPLFSSLPPFLSLFFLFSFFVFFILDARLIGIRPRRVAFNGRRKHGGQTNAFFRARTNFAIGNPNVRSDFSAAALNLTAVVEQKRSQE